MGDQPQLSKVVQFALEQLSQGREQKFPWRGTARSPHSPGVPDGSCASSTEGQVNAQRQVCGSFCWSLLSQGDGDSCTEGTGSPKEICRGLQCKKPVLTCDVYS